MNIYKVLPSLDRERQMKLWHKAQSSQWSAEDINWEAPQRLTSDRTKDGLARILTPVLMGEQAALYSVSSLIPILGHRSEVGAQFFLTTWAVDEARHTELFTRFYGRLDRQPMSIRRFPSGYFVQSEIRSEDPGTWLAGVLVSEVAAKHITQELLRLDLDPVLSEISDGILVDEARHLAFNHIYLEDLFAGLFRKAHSDAASYAAETSARLESVLSKIPAVFAALQGDLIEVGIDQEKLFAGIAAEARERLQSSIDRGQRAALRQTRESGLVAADNAR